MNHPVKTEELHLDDPFDIPEDPKSVPAGIRAQMAFELRKAGAGYGLIAEKLGYANEATAENAIRRVLSTKYKPDDVDAVVEMELARLDSLQLVAWRRAKNGDLAAIDRILKIMERRSQYLGLDKQTKETQGNVVNQTAIFIGGSEEEYVQALKQAREQTKQRILEG